MIKSPAFIWEETYKILFQWQSQTALGICFAQSFMIQDLKLSSESLRTFNLEKGHRIGTPVRQLLNYQTQFTIGRG